MSSSLVKRGGLFGGGVIAASPSGKVGGVGGHSNDDMVSHRIFAKPRSSSTLVFVTKMGFLYQLIVLDFTRIDENEKE